MFTHFFLPLFFFSVAFLIDFLYVLFSDYKRWLKVWRMMVCLAFIILYTSAAQVEASYFIRSGQATAIIQTFLALSFMFDTIADMARR